MTSIQSEVTPGLLLAASTQIALCLLGLGCQWHYWRDRRAAPALKPWPIGPADFGKAMLFTTAFGVAMQFALIQLLAPRDDALWQLLVPGGALQFGVLAGALISTQLWLRQPRLAGAGADSWDGLVTEPIDEPPALPRTTRRMNPLLHGAMTFAALVPITIGASLLWQTTLEQLGIEAPRQELIDMFSQARFPGPFLALCFIAVVLAPLTEEIVFRAGLFRIARAYLPRWAAVMGPAALFALLHFNLASFLPLFVLGVFFTLAYEHTGKLTVPILAHALFNLNTILLVLCGVTQ